jgi:uncharacterized protein YbjT (DUF2867 family)
MSNLNNILVLGATGQYMHVSSILSIKIVECQAHGIEGATGLIFIKAALQDSRRPHLTLYVRNPSKVPHEYTTNDRITVVQGSLDDVASLTKAMRNVTSVISLLGAYITLSNFLTRSTATPIADNFPTIFTAMRANGVKRIMALSSVGGFQRPGDYVPYGRYWLFTYVAPKVVVPGGAAEMRRIGEVVAGSEGLEWTVFRIPHLNDGDAEGALPVEVRETFDEDYKGGLELSRMSLVKWVLDELEEGKWVRKTPVVGNPW